VFDLCSGPAKLAQALCITRTLNGADLCLRRGAELWLEDAPPIPDNDIVTTPRVGLNHTLEPWKSMPWRFFVQGSAFISKVKS
jgi:DNA-3-methyladenine glycosylase